MTNEETRNMTFFTVYFTFDGRRYKRAIVDVDEQAARAAVDEKWPGARITTIKSNGGA